MAKTTNNTQFDGNLDLSITRKKRFTIDSDANRVLELNTSDLGIITRLNEAYPKLKDLVLSVEDTQQELESDEESLKQMSNILNRVDKEMRELMDYIFDTNVSEVCAPSGSMLDPIGGGFRYEHIINALSNKLDEDITKETKKIQNRISNHTSKYTKN